MRYYSRLNLYKASNVTFDPNKIEAKSYEWWTFVAVIDGLVVFNSKRYSSSTSKHQYKVKQLMHSLGIKIDIEAPFIEHLGGYLDVTKENIINIAEEALCNKFLQDEAKKIRRAERNKAQKLSENVGAENNNGG